MSVPPGVPLSPTTVAQRERESLEIAALRRQADAVRANGLRAGESPQSVLIVDDNPGVVRALWREYLDSHDLDQVATLSQLWQHIDAVHAGGRVMPLLALVDLELGEGQASGLASLDVLKDVWPALPVALFVSGLADHRDLLVRLAADLNGPGIHVVPKEDVGMVALRELVAALQHVPAAARRLDGDGRVGGIRPAVRWVRPLRVVPHDRQHHVPLLEHLLGTPERRAYWAEMSKVGGSGDHAGAMRRVIDVVGRVKDPVDYSRKWATANGLLPRHWMAVGKDMLALPDTLLLDSEAARDLPSQKASMASFASRYDRVLADEFVHSLAEGSTR